MREPVASSTIDKSGHIASDETTPLIANDPINPTSDPEVAESIVDPDTTTTNDDDKPLPIGQIFFLCIGRFVEPIAFFGIFPFVNQMVQDNGSLPESSVGFYSGLIESLFSLTQMVVMIFWGRISDRSGRKPVLVVSMIGVAVFTAAFGLSTTIWQMILFRCLAGVFAGTIVTIRTMIAELSTPKTQAKAFSYFSFASNLGMFVGPLIGGALADPAGQYGGVFKNVSFFNRFPYALATFAFGCIGLTTSIIISVFVKETLPSKTGGTSRSTNGKAPTKQLSIWELIAQPGVLKVLWLFSHIMLLAFAYTAVVPVFWFTSIRLGGLALTPVQISIFMALNGAAQAMWILLAFPPLQRRFSTGGVLRGCSIAYPFFFLCNPLLNLLLRHAEANHSHSEKTLFWVIGPLLSCIGVGVSMAFTAIQLAINDIAPSPATLGTLNGIALSCSSGVRAFSPAMFTSIFAAGVSRQILGGHLIWLVLIVLALGYTVLVRTLPAKAEGRIVDDDNNKRSNRTEA